jgi:hypothetical protein
MSEGLAILSSIGAIALGTYFFVYVFMLLLRRIEKNESAKL